MNTFWRRGLLIAGLTIAGALAAGCSSSTTGGATDGGKTNNGGGGKGGDPTKNGNCPSASDAGSKCTEDELNSYNECSVTKCDSQYKTALGNDYASGTFGGACGSYITCTNGCGCPGTSTYSSCVQNCGQPSADCSNALSGVTSCITSNCTLPACATSGSGGLGDGGGGGGTCTDLAACCAQISDANQKSACNQYVSSGQDSTCGSILNAYKSGNLCQ